MAIIQAFEEYYTRMNIITFDPLDTLRARLEVWGHKLEETGSADFRVCPMSDSSIVVAIQPDVALYPAYRRRYFLCRQGAEAILTRTVCPVSLQQRWYELLGRMKPGQSRDLLVGPGSWTLARLTCHKALLIWGVGDAYWEQSDWNKEYEQIENDLATRIDFTPWRKHLAEGTNREVYHLNPNEDRFAHVLASYFLLSSYNSFNFYITDHRCTEVYEIHHYDKVTASLPMPESLQEAYVTLKHNPDIYIDILCYENSWDREGSPER
jgi:hypothetical protein